MKALELSVSPQETFTCTPTREPPTLSSTSLVVDVLMRDERRWWRTTRVKSVTHKLKKQTPVKHPHCLEPLVEMHHYSLTGTGGTIATNVFIQPGCSGSFNVTRQLSTHITLWLEKPQMSSAGAHTRTSAAYVQYCCMLCNPADFYLPTEHLHSAAAASPRACAHPHLSVYSDDGHQPTVQSLL